MKHQWREGNRVADLLAKNSTLAPAGLTVIRDPPLFVRQTLLDDIRGVTLPRVVSL